MQNDVASDAGVSDSDGEEKKRDVIIVLGTYIRGVAPESLPACAFDGRDILNSDASAVQDFIQLLPQNIGGGSNSDFLGVSNDVNSGFNTPQQGERMAPA